MQYEKMTNKELNLKLAELFPDFNVSESQQGCVGDEVMVNDACSSWAFNPTSNWSDIMPIATEFGIDLKFNGGFSKTWSAEYYNYIDYYDVEYIGVENQKSPQRALVICCIKVLGE